MKRLFRNLIIGAGCFLSFGVGNSFSAEPREVKPSETDPEIHSFNDPHYAWTPGAGNRHQLLVFLPGTDGAPKSSMPFVETAVGLGYYAISLMYPNTVAAQAVCDESRDPMAHLHFRLEIIQGQDLSPLIQISPVDSIENRLLKLLLFLKAQAPAEGWEEFLTAESQVNWESLLIAGQSQGGGHAYVIGKIHEVARVLMFGSLKDYNHHFNGPPKGFDEKTKTPLQRFFAFNHMKDTKGGVDHSEQLQIFKKIGLTELGQELVDKSEPPYNHAHLLYTDVELPNMNDMSAIHNTPLNNKRIKDDSGNIRFKSVWNYLLTEP